MRRWKAVEEGSQEVKTEDFSEWGGFNANDFLVFRGNTLTHTHISLVW